MFFEACKACRCPNREEVKSGIEPSRSEDGCLAVLGVLVKP